MWLIGKYEAYDPQPLGKGGQGEVYRVKLRNVVSPEAAKIIEKAAQDGNGYHDVFLRVYEQLDELSWDDDAVIKFPILTADPAACRAMLANFWLEVAMLKRLRHPNIVRMLGCALGVFGGFVRPYILLEDAGISLRFVQENIARASLGNVTGAALEASGPEHELGRRLEPGLAAVIALDVMAALACMHAEGVVHRDIKPDNILIGRDGYARLCDFGIAKSQDLGGSTTQVGLPKGTTTFLSPEQVRCEELDGRSDQWAVGVLLYEMLTGRRPWAMQKAPAQAPKALKEKYVAEVYEQIEEAPTPPLPDSVPAPVTAVFERLLQKNRERRYPDMAAAIEALQSATAGLVGSWTARRELAEQANMALRRGSRAKDKKAVELHSAAHTVQVHARGDVSLEGAYEPSIFVSEGVLDDLASGIGGGEASTARPLGARLAEAAEEDPDRTDVPIMPAAASGNRRRMYLQVAFIGAAVLMAASLALGRQWVGGTGAAVPTVGTDTLAAEASTASSGSAPDRRDPPAMMPRPELAGIARTDIAPPSLAEAKDVAPKDIGGSKEPVLPGAEPSTAGRTDDDRAREHERVGDSSTAEGQNPSVPMEAKDVPRKATRTEELATVDVVVVPGGAWVALDDDPPRRAPTVFSGVKPGAHTLRFGLGESSLDRVERIRVKRGANEIRRVLNNPFSAKAASDGLSPFN